MKPSLPRLLLHLEGATVLVAACFFYQHLHGSWLWFGLLFLLPDICLLGYFAGNKAGAICYNVAHTYVVPFGLLGILWSCGQASLYWPGLIWIAHIGFDRLLGFGLKYEASFKDTHLQRV